MDNEISEECVELEMRNQFLYELETIDRYYLFNTKLEL